MIVELYLFGEHLHYWKNNRFVEIFPDEISLKRRLPWIRLNLFLIRTFDLWTRRNRFVSQSPHIFRIFLFCRMQFSQMLQDETQCSIKLLRKKCRTFEQKLFDSNKNFSHNSLSVSLSVCVNLIFETKMRERPF